MQNTVEDIHDYMFATGDNSYAYVGDSSFVGQAALNTSRKLWDDVLGGSTDDAQVRSFAILPGVFCTKLAHPSGSS